MPMLITLRMRLPVCPFHFPLRTRLEKSGHLVEHRMDLRHHILAVDDDGGSFGRAQGHVQHRALLGGVDLLAAKHGVDSRPQARFLGQFEEKLDGFSGDAVLRVVEEGRQPPRSSARRASGRRQTAFADAILEHSRSGLETLPGLAFDQRFDAALACGACHADVAMFDSFPLCSHQYRPQTAV
jgi:hypothetical protein